MRFSGPSRIHHAIDRKNRTGKVPVLLKPAPNRLFPQPVKPALRVPPDGETIAGQSIRFIATTPRNRAIKKKERPGSMPGRSFPCELKKKGADPKTGPFLIFCVRLELEPQSQADGPASLKPIWLAVGTGNRERTTA